MPPFQLSFPPRLVISAPQGRSGKTIIALGLCSAFSGRGLSVQPFKKGPDYIDPSWLSAACGRSCRSLDPFFYPNADDLRNAFLQGSRQADLALIEGNHGLYDSQDEDGQGSTAAVARTLDAPVLFVVNAARMSRSAAAMISGYQNFEPGTKFVGVILNNVSGSHGGRHEAKLRAAIESYCRLPVLGALPRQDDLIIPDRHLGLVPRFENRDPLGVLEACRQAAEKYLDLDRILELAQEQAGEWRVQWDEFQEGTLVSFSKPQLPVPIGVLKDRAFTFYYPENLEALQAAGAELVFIDSFTSPGLPPLAGLYIGGGFPEVFMDELSANRLLREAIRQAVEAGLPVYAECGGLMYLSRKIHWQGRQAEMVGALPFEIELTGQPQGHGYVIARTILETPVFPAGVELRGHEFHHSHLVKVSEDLPAAYRLERGSGLGGGRDGIVYRNVLAAYTHLHAGGAPGWASGFVARAAEYQAGMIVG